MAYYPFSKETKERFGIVLTSNFGVRRGGFHYGADYAPSRNRGGDIPIIASVDGELITNKDEHGGLWSYIKGIDGRGYLTVHHKKWIRRWGKVKAGEIIALMGRSGNVRPKDDRGTHTHFEIRSKSWMNKGDINPERAGLQFISQAPNLSIKKFNVKEYLRLLLSTKKVHEWLDKVQKKGVTLLPNLANHDKEEFAARIYELRNFQNNNPNIPKNEAIQAYEGLLKLAKS